MMDQAKRGRPTIDPRLRELGLKPALVAVIEASAAAGELREDMTEEEIDKFIGDVFDAHVCSKICHVQAFLYKALWSHDWEAAFLPC